jgi:hypothetical protein
LKKKKDTNISTNERNKIEEEKKAEMVSDVKENQHREDKLVFRGVPRGAEFFANRKKFPERRTAHASRFCTSGCPEHGGNPQSSKVLFFLSILDTNF